MRSISVRSLKHSYRVLVGDSLLKNTGSCLRSLGLRGKVMVVTQRRVAKHYLKTVRASLGSREFDSHVYYLPEGEIAKSQAELFKLFGALFEKKFERGDIIIALGGGVTGDLAGFAASVYLRGIAFINIPTTLLAQVDSAIGGKTAINTKQGKNLIGAFYPPRVVLSDTGTLRTLPRRELCASMAEVIKYGVIQDPVLFSLLEKTDAKKVMKQKDILTRIVADSSSIKGRVVSHDEFEQSGLRMILNYGHTFGHAFEKVLGFKTLMHGEAVAVGMVCAAKLAVMLKMIPEKTEKRQTAVIKKFGLPVSLNKYKIKADAAMKAMLMDKKVKQGRLRFVLPNKIGKVKVVTGVASEKVRQALIEAGARK